MWLLTYMIMVTDDSITIPVFPTCCAETNGMKFMNNWKILQNRMASYQDAGVGVVTSAI